MFDKGTIVCMLLIVSVAIVLFLYVQQKTSRIEKNIKNVISFIKDVEQRVKENDNNDDYDVKHVSMNLNDDQDNEARFLSVHKNEIVAQQYQEDEDEDEDEDDDDDSSESESEEEVEEEGEGLTLEAEVEADVDAEVEAEVEAEVDAEVEAETLAQEASLDSEVVNIKFKVDSDSLSDYKKLPVSELRELITSLDIQVEDVQKLKKKEAQTILENYYAEQDNNNNIDI